ASSTVFCQNVPATTVYSSRWAPAPSRPSWVSPPPAATGVPGRSPVSSAAAALTSPTTVPGSTTGGKTSAGRPLSAGMVGDQPGAERPARRGLAAGGGPRHGGGRGQRGGGRADRAAAG